jgi:septin family protein
MGITSYFETFNIIMMFRINLENFCQVKFFKYPISKFENDDFQILDITFLRQIFMKLIVSHIIELIEVYKRTYYDRKLLIYKKL